MHNISLIFTRHKTSGNCNSYELYKIIQSINPEVIFEELSFSNFHKSYEEKNLITLETNAIKMYLLEHPIKHLPVDTFFLNRSYDEDLEYMYNRILDNIAHNDPSNPINLIAAYASSYGFRFLNSEHNNDLFRKFETIKAAVLNLLNDDRLFQINKLEKEVIEKRENEMLTNIYLYSRENEYRHGLFFIGSGHRESILQKIRKNNEIWKPKINWIIYDQ